MRKIIYIFILLSNFIFAQNNANQKFEAANELYRKDQFEAAAKQYESILNDNKLASADLYFNLGNCYYKLGKVAPSIYNFEKALLLNPNDEAVKTNLTFAQKMAIDDIKTVPEVGFSKVVYNITSWFSYDTWAWITVSCAGLFLLFFIGYYFASLTNLKRTFFLGMFVLLGLIVATLTAAFLQKRFSNKIRPAIVFAESTFVKAEPKNSAENAFELHEGTKVYVKEELDNWKRIQLTDKTEGWIKKDAIKELKD